MHPMVGLGTLFVVNFLLPENNKLTSLKRKKLIYVVKPGIQAFILLNYSICTYTLV